jgi:hypothetical protein
LNKKRKGERAIAEVLEKYNIYVQVQYSGDDLI